MPMRASDALWEGSFTAGSGSVKLESGQHEIECAFTHSSRVGDGEGTNPEQLIAAAHASCFSMALAYVLTHAGQPPARVHTRSRVLLAPAGAGFQIPRIELQADAVVPGIDSSTFQTCVEAARSNCAVSKLLTGAEITVSAVLLEPRQDSPPPSGAGRRSRPPGPR